MNYKRKNILFLGGGRSNIGAVKVAKQMGFNVYIAGLPDNAMCYSFADKYINANIMDKYAVGKALEREHIDGVLICCSDRAIETAGYLNDRLGLCGISEKSAMLSCNKFLMKESLIKGGVNTAKYLRIYTEFDLEEANNVIPYPMMIKAVDSQSSNGIYICDNYEELKINYRKAMSITHERYCIVEEFLKGKELGCQAFVYNSEIIFIMPHGDLLIKERNSTVPIGHYTPLDIDDKTHELIVKETAKAIYALGFNNCAVNIDIILKDGVPYILELTGRVGANCLPELVSHYMGIEYYKMIVSAAVGENPKQYFTPSVSNYFLLTRMIKSYQDGIYEGVDMKSAEATYISFFPFKGERIHKFRNSNDCIGEMLVQGTDLESCMKKADEILNNIEIDIRF